MDSIWIAGGFVLFAWWFSTGAILFLVSRAERGGPLAHQNAVILALPVLFLGIWGVSASLGDPSLAGVYLAFLSALAIWGWFELAFLAGVLTGPMPKPCPPGVPPLERFLRAWGTIAYSETALVAIFAILLLVSRGAENMIAFWTFAVLFFARVTAKLNVYLGVPNINDHFLPAPVRYLSTHFRKGPVNPFFPVAVTLLTFATACWIERLIAMPAGSAEAVGFMLLATLTALALLEHWLMVLPLRDAALWTWALPSHKSGADRDPASAPARRQT
jgi:putative photosynthetic complex assembly protein 2